MHEGAEKSVSSEKASLRELLDPTPPEPGERRLDSDGVAWAWVPSHHSVAEELDIASSNGDYWDKRLTVNSDDAEKQAQGEPFVVDVSAQNSAFAQPAYKWQLVH